MSCEFKFTIDSQPLIKTSSKLTTALTSDLTSELTFKLTWFNDIMKTRADFYQFKFANMKALVENAGFYMKRRDIKGFS